MIRYCSSVALLAMIAFGCSSKNSNGDDTGFKQQVGLATMRVVPAQAVVPELPAVTLALAKSLKAWRS